jgi:hypothetical protein
LQRNQMIVEVIHQGAEENAAAGPEAGAPAFFILGRI